MAFGSGSSLATDCSTRCRGSPASLQLWRAGLASRLNQVRPRNLRPTPEDLRPGGSIGRAAFFSSVLGMRGSNPPLGSLPTYPHPRQRCPDGLSCDALLGQALFEADLGG